MGVGVGLEASGLRWVLHLLGQARFSPQRKRESDTHPFDDQNAGAEIPILETFHVQLAWDLHKVPVITSY